MGLMTVDADHKADNAAGPAVLDDAEIPAVWADVLVCLLLGGLGVWFVVEALQLQSHGRGIGPGAFPATGGGLLVLLSATQIVLAITRKATSGTITVQRPLWLVIAMVLIGLFPTAIGMFGYYATSVIWIPLFGWIAGSRSPIGLLVTTALVLAMARFVFEMLLGTPLP